MSDDPGKRRAWQTDSEWAALRGRVEATESHGVYLISTKRRRYQYAALAAAIVGIAFALRSVPRSETHVIFTKAGERTVVHLDDSSEIALGPASRIEYSIGRTRRDVTLDGLAEFKIVHDATRPFVVRAKNAITTDLGTEFIIRAYASDTVVRVAVTSGAVSFTGTKASPTLELRGGQVGEIAVNGIARADANAIAASDAAWMDGRLRFNDTSLEEIAVELSRWFDADVRVPDDVLARRRVTAVYTNPSLAGVLDALTTTVGARYERSGRVITIRPRVP